MLVVVIAGLLTLVGVSIAVGAKLLLLARRTRAFPELALGLYFFLGGAIGYPLSGAAPLAGDWEPWLAAASAGVISVATVMLYAFTARVFHPGRPAGRLCLATGVLLCATYAVGYSTSQLSAESHEELLRSTMTWGGLSLLMSAVGYAWSGFAALNAWGQQRRRLAIGLGDPVVANRMLLWGLMNLSILSVVVVDTVLLYGGSSFARDTLIPIATSAGGLAVGAFLMLAFFPPDRYLAAIRRRGPAVEATNE